MGKTILFLAVVAVAPLLAAGPASAQIYPWCAQYSGSTGATNCGFTSEAQCRAAVSGAGGFCYRNPMWLSPSERQPRDRRPRNDN